MGYQFDGPNKLIIIDDTASFTAQDLYSRWKDWVMVGTNSTYAPAFRSVGGDPIGGGNFIAPYFFLNNAEGWRIRPYEDDYALTITGNLYPEDSNTEMFVPTLGGYTVTTVIERSSAAIAISVGGIDQATVQAAMTAQGYTQSRAPRLDNLDAAVSAVGGLTGPQTTMLLEMYRLLGLDPTRPLVVQATYKGAGPDIEQDIAKVGGTVTVTRRP